MPGKQEVGRVSSVVGVLQHTAMFTGMPTDELRSLAAGGWQRSYGAQQPIARNDCTEALRVIEQGAVRLFQSCAAGNDVTLWTLSAGAVFGLSPYAAAVMAASTLEAVEPRTVVHILARRQVDAVLRRNPELALRVIEQLGQQVEALCGRVEELALHPVRARLAHELGSRAQLDGQDQIHATHEELAARIGSKQVEVSRALRFLRAEGLITSAPHRRGITVLDAATLAEY